MKNLVAEHYLLARSKRFHDFIYLLQDALRKRGFEHICSSIKKQDKYPNLSVMEGLFVVSWYASDPEEVCIDIYGNNAHIPVVLYSRCCRKPVFQYAFKRSENTNEFCQKVIAKVEEILHKATLYMLFQDLGRMEDEELLRKLFEKMKPVILAHPNLEKYVKVIEKIS